MIKQILFFLLPIVSFSQTFFFEVDEMFQNKQYAKAEVVLSTYLNDSPNDVKALELLGDTFAHQENWDEAIVIYKQLVEVEPLSANYHYKYGGVLGLKAMNSNKIIAFFLVDDIEEELKLAAKLDPNHIEVRWALIDFYIQIPNLIGGSEEVALGYAEELEVLSQVDGYLSKGYIYEYNDEPELAEQYYRMAIEVGGSLTSFKKLTSLYENQDRPLDAISNIENANEKLNRNSLNYQLGKVCANYNLELDKGEMCLMKFIDNYSVKDGVPLKWAYLKLAQIYKHKNDKSNALKWINKSLADQSDFEPALDEKELILEM